MSRLLALAYALAAVVSLPSSVAQSSPSAGASPNTSQGAPILAELFLPVYPPLARVAHIEGEVNVLLEVRRDGSIESARVVSGSGFLRQAAIDSAQQSEFECLDCSDAAIPYHLIYSFQLGPSRCTNERNGPLVSQSKNHVTVVDNPTIICDSPVHGLWKVRSAKCLYLWRCGLREGS